MPGGRDDIPYLAKSSKLLYKAGWRDKSSSTHPESDCASVADGVIDGLDCLMGYLAFCWH